VKHRCSIRATKNAIAILFIHLKRLEMKRFLFLFLSTMLVNFYAFGQTVEFSDDFESGTDNWTLEGAWGTTTTQSNSPSTSLTDSPGGNYAASLNISATMATGVDLSSALDAELNFWAIYDIEGGNFDYMYVEASGDGGVTWVNIATFLGEGNLSPWVQYNYSLGGFVGSDDVKVRFRFFSDGGYEVDGMYIDDVEILSSNEDNSAPLILHTPTTFYRSNIGDVTKTADLIDVSGIASATLYYSVDGGVANSITGTNTVDDTYEFVIPEQAAGAQVDYFIEAADASANANTQATQTHSYIDGNHIYYDNEAVDFVNSFGPDAAGFLSGCAVRFSLVGTTDVAYALIRNYTDPNRPNDDFEFHIWADEGGVPGADLITPFMVTPEANLDVTSPMTRIDLSAYAGELSGLTGDVFVGYTVPEGQTWLVQSTPAVGGRTFTFDGSLWSSNTADDYHFRIVTTEFASADVCAEATDLSALMGQAIGSAQTSPIWNNSEATTDANDPADGFECFGEPDGGGATPSLENTVWFTFTGDGELYEIVTTDCGGGLNDYIDFGDTQLAIYEGMDCNNLTAVACNDDINGTPPAGPYPAGLVFETTPGTIYYMMVDGFAGSDGEFCVQFTHIANVTCDDISLGTSTAEANICSGDITVFTIEDVVVPLSPAAGFLWVVTSADITGSVDPFNEASFLGNFAITTEAYAPALVNDGTQLPPAVYYFTPIAFGGAVDTDGPLAEFDFTDGCVLTGQSFMVSLYPEFEALSGTPIVVSESGTGGGDGEASVDITGGSGNYSYNWSQGGTTQTITGLFAATYTVTVTDLSGCVDDVIVDVIVDVVIGTADIEFSKAISLYPNPASNKVTINFNFEETLDLEIEMINVIGQVVLEQKEFAVKGGQLSFNLESLTEGVYFVHITDGERKFIQRLVVN
jgi:hypothetical protein